MFIKLGNFIIMVRISYYNVPFWFMEISLFVIEQSNLILTKFWNDPVQCDLELDFIDYTVSE